MVPHNKKYVSGKLLLKTENLPRQKTDELSFTLEPSRIEGVGVFATHDIKKGVRLKLFPGVKTRFFTHAQFKKLNPLKQSFCIRYGVEDADGVYVSQNFSHMEIGWYLNHSNKPNACHDENYDYFSSRYIKRGEEITIDYEKL